MQNRYTADVGDFAKYGLLRALGEGQLLGVAWYLFPDESQNNDGGLTSYLEDPYEWRHLDPILFDGLRSIVQGGRRDVRLIEVSGLLGNVVFSNVPLIFKGSPAARARQRASWFKGILSDLEHCSVVFADPDNGLREDRTFAMADRRTWKQLPLSEAHVLAAGRTGVFYHHNTRRRGGHCKEIQDWLALLGADTMALYWRRFINRTFFIVHPTRDIEWRAREFAKKWSPHFELHELSRSQSLREQRIDDLTVKGSDQTAKHKACPECGHVFNGKGWGGIDAHWKANHDDIMAYDSAWPIIKVGRKPSTVGSNELR